MSKKISRWMAMLVCIVMAVGQTPVMAAPPEEQYVLNNGGFTLSVGAFAAEQSLGTELDARVAKDGAAAEDDAATATGQTLELCSEDGAVISKSRIIVLGDVLGTGTAGISQVIRIARAMSGADPLEGIWLRAGDFNDSGTIDLSDVVQSAEELMTVSSTESAQFSEKAAHLHFSTPDNGLDLPMYLPESMSEVPYISTDGMQGILNETFARLWQEAPCVIATGDETVTLRRSNGSTAVLDFEKNTVLFPDFGAFFRAPGAATVLDPLAESDDSKYISRAAGSFERSGRPVTIDLAKYEIETVWRGRRGYLPLRTFGDLFIAPLRMRLLYTDSMAAVCADGQQEAFFDLIYAKSPKDRSAELAAFTYNELCLVLDTFYGLKEQHGITDFDTLLQSAGLADALLSPDPAAADKALSALSDAYLGDLHTRVEAPSPYAGRDADIRSDLMAVSLEEYEADCTAISAERAAAFPNGVSAYEEFGSTAFVTLDTLEADFTKDYPAAFVLSEHDTVSTIAYAHSQIMREGSPIETVVVDISSVRRGQLDCAVYALGWMLGTAQMNLNDTLTGAQASTRYQSDVNLDGVSDDADTLQSKRVVCLVSPACLGAANAMAAALKGTNVTLVGQQTAGGACIPMPIAAADGTLMVLSGPRRVSVLQNGAYYDADRGIEPDFRLPQLRDFYNREKLAAYLCKLFEQGTPAIPAGGAA